MDPLRIFLFSGMVFHKLVWEWLKRKDQRAVSTPSAPGTFGFKSLVKLAKIGVLLFLIIQTLFLDLFPIFDNPQAIRIVGGLIYVIGLAVAITGRFQLGRNWANIEDYQVLKGQDMVDSGIYRFIRHPIYIGDVLLILGLELALNSWLFLGVIPLFVYVDYQARSEEKVLKQAFPGYALYMERTKKFIPYVY